MNIRRLIIMAVLIPFFVTVAEAQVEAPTISSASFDSDGKLVVKTKFSAIEGCYIALNGGLSKNSVETGITSVQLSSSQASRGVVTLRTKRRYYCSKRTLFVNTELVCLNSLIGSATSSAKAVAVPSVNVKR